MRFGLRFLFGLVTIVAVSLGVMASIWKTTDDYRNPRWAAVWYVSSADAKQLSITWLKEHRFASATIPPEIFPVFDIDIGGLGDAEAVKCVGKFRNEDVPGLPIYASLGVAPVDGELSLVKIEFHSRFRAPVLFAGKFERGQAHLNRLQDESHDWLEEQARASGAPPHVMRFVRCCNDEPVGSAFELARPMAEILGAK